MNLPHCRPVVEYGLISPMLIVLGAAVLGVLVEAFLPRQQRYAAQVTLSLGALVAAFVAVVHARLGTCTAATVQRRDGCCRRRQARPVPAGHHPAGRRARHPADRRAPDRRPGDADDEAPAGWTRSPRRRPRSPGSVAEKLATKAGVVQTEVFPLTMFARRRDAAVPRGQRSADDVHRAGGAVAAAVPAVRAGAAATAAVAGVRAEILSARARSRRRSSSTASPCCTAMRAPCRCSGIADAVSSGTGKTVTGADRHRAAAGRGAVQSRCGAVPFVDPRRLPGRADPDHGVHGRGHQDRRVRRDAADLLRRAARAARRLAARAVGDRDPDDGGRHRHRGHPDRRQAHAGRIRRSRTPASSSPASSPATRPGSRRRCSTCSPTGSPPSARSPWSAWSATPTARKTPRWRAGRVSAGGIPLVGIVFSLFLLAFAGIPLTSGFVSKFAVFKAAGEGGAHPAGRRRRDRQRDRRVLLRAGDRADVLHRPPRRRARRGGAQRADDRASSPSPRRSPSRSARCRSRCSTWPTPRTTSSDTTYGHDRRLVLTADHGAVRVLTLNRPAARNALSRDLIRAPLRGADGRRRRRVGARRGAHRRRPGVLRGRGPQRGGARRAVVLRGVPVAELHRRGGARCARRWSARSTAATFTGGLEMALGCDFLIASERAVFADTHARVGILPGGGMTARLPQLVGAAMARRLSMTGEVVDAARAERIGLVTEVVPHDRAARAGRRAGRADRRGAAARRCAASRRSIRRAASAVTDARAGGRGDDRVRPAPRFRRARRQFQCGHAAEQGRRSGPPDRACVRVQATTPCTTMAVVLSTHAGSSRSSGASSSASSVAPPIRSTSRSGSTSARTSPRSTASVQPGAHRAEQVGEAGHHPAV